MLFYQRPITKIDKKNSEDITILDVWNEHSDDTIFTEFGTMLIKNTAEKSEHLTIPHAILSSALKRYHDKSLFIDGLQCMHTSSEKSILNSIETTFPIEDGSRQDHEGAVDTSYIFTIPSTIKNVTIKYVNDNIKDNKDITHVVISEDVEIIDPSAFSECKNLRSVTMLEGIRHIGRFTFHGCTSLTSINIPGSARGIYYGAFFDCTSLKSVVISQGVKSISRDVFDGCTSLTSIVFPENMEGVRYVTIKDCTNLKFIVLPDRLCNSEH